MTALRPERESAAGGPVDPLTDPLPDVLAGGHSSPWFRAEQPPQQVQGHDLSAPQPPPADPYAQLPADAYAAPPQDDAYVGHSPYEGGPGWTASPETYPAPEVAEEPYRPVPEAPRDDETMALRAADPARTDEERDETPPATTTAAGAEGGRAARRKAAKRNARPGGRRGTGRR
ncbi:class E sortase, partial [Streptomyces sp. SID8385]|nr:class E sortase [Streptomyces sp. SID8385]